MSRVGNPSGLSILCITMLLLAACQPQARAAKAPEPGVLAYEAQPELLIEQIVRIRGVSDRRRTGIVFDEEQAFVRALASKVEADAIGPSDADAPAFPLAFEFPPPSARQGSTWGDVYEEQLLGFYDEHSHAVHLRKALLNEKSELEVAAVLAHELTHSLQAQHFALPSIASVHSEDVRLAHLALVEGDAMLVMLAYVSARQRVPLSRALARASRSATELELYSRGRGGQRALANAPPLLRERISFPYAYGMAFMSALYRAGGFPLLNRVYGNPPQSSEHVLHPEKYLAGESPVPVRAPAPPDGYVVVASGSVGELQVRAILSYCVPPVRAASAAAGWGGDAYTVVVREERDAALLWSTTWDDEREATEFEAALRDYVKCTRSRAGTHVMPLTDEVKRQGKRVALVRGLAAPAARRLLPGLFALVDEAPRTVPPFGPIVIPALKPVPAFRAPHLSAGRYVNEQLGVHTSVPRGFAAELGGPTSVTLTGRAPEPVVMGMELSEQLADRRTVDALHSSLAGELRRALDDVELEYVRGRDVQLSALGKGVEREWRVQGSSGGLKAAVFPLCSGTGSLVLWAAWADARGLPVIDGWLGSVARTHPGEPPICAELDP